MFKRDGKLIGHTIPPGDLGASVEQLRSQGIEVGAYEFDGDQWQWTREF